MPKRCTPHRWERAATRVALLVGVEPSKVLAGDRHREYVEVRRAVWRTLAHNGYSYASIGKISGFDHTTVIHAVKRADR